MALEGTHIQFALDVQNIYKPDNLDQYVSGAVYPDSRYMTGIDRSLTHYDELYTVDASEKSNFKKGMASHMVCDKVMNDTMVALFPDRIANDGSHADWVFRTALKILTDMEVFRKHNFQKHLKLTYIENPCGEDREILLKYNMVMRDAYLGISELTLDACMKVWQALNVGVEICDDLSNEVKKLTEESDIMKYVPTIYPEMLERAQQYGQD